MLELTARNATHFELSGEPEFDDAGAACSFLDAPLAQIGATEEGAANREITVSLAGVKNSNSVLVSLLLVWMRRAHRAGIPIRFTDIPPSASSLIDFTGLDEVLPIGDKEAAA